MNYILQKKHKISFLEKIVCSVLLFLIPLVLIINIGISGFHIAIVEGSSMEPAMKSGQVWTLTNKKKGVELYNIDDIIVFHPPVEDTNEKFVKRIVAVEGDIIKRIDQFLFVNGVAVIEQENSIEAGLYLNSEVVVPKNNVYVIGDNFQNSFDSRSFSFVDIESITGKVQHKIWSFNNKNSDET